MENNYTIGITTFSLRYDLVEKLLNQIRTYTNEKILLCINGEKDGNFNNEYRKKVLKLCFEYNDVFPIFFIETRGLAKMWNTILIHSDNRHLMMLNDDIIIQSEDVFIKTHQHINSSDFKGLTLLNSSFSHYIVDRELINDMGYFDERLIGFGEEDGDIVYRLKKINKNVDFLWVNGLINIISPIRQEEIKKGSINNIEHKYSDFNRMFIYGEKYITDLQSPYKGMFDTPMKQNLIDEKIYPYEKFYWNNKNKLYN